jgi:hypothetical protein
MTAPGSSTSPSAATAPSVRSSGNAPLAWSTGSRATSIRMPATMPRRSCRPRPIGSHAPHGRRSKPYLARPSISSRWCASDCGLSGARDEFLLAATVQNVKRLAAAHDEAAATAHDSLTNAKKLNATPSIGHQPPRRSAQPGRQLFDLSRAGPKSRTRPDFLNGLSQKLTFRVPEIRSGPTPCSARVHPRANQSSSPRDRAPLPCRPHPRRSHAASPFRWSARRSARAMIISVGEPVPAVGNTELPAM